MTLAMLSPRRAAGAAKRAARNLYLFGGAVSCPVCGRSFRRLLPFNGRENVMCPSCGSLERHRLAWLLLQSRLQRPRTRILHFAPEQCLASRLRLRADTEYITADLLSQQVDLKLDITDMPSELDRSYDVVVCSHVLEHVTDDRAALRELYRLLAPGGWALLGVPINPALDVTYEDWSITDPEGRNRHFGQWDHVRFYAREDFISRVRETGFDVEIVDAGSYDPDGRQRLERHLTRVGADLIVIAHRSA